MTYTTTFKMAQDGITWGYNAETAEAAVRDTAELGYTHYETMTPVLDAYEAQVGDFGALLKHYGLSLCALYVPVNFHNPTHAVPDVVPAALRSIRRAHELGANAVVLQAAGKQGRPYTHATQWEGMGAIFTGIARRSAELGMVTSVHPHTGTLIETRAEIDAILAAVDPKLVGFAPDTGQMAKAGADVIDTLRAYKERIWHVHLKDYGGGKETGYAGYEPIGHGVLDMPAIFGILDEIQLQGWVTVELDGTPQAPRPPREAAAMSKRYLEGLLGQNASW